MFEGKGASFRALANQSVLQKHAANMPQVCGTGINELALLTFRSPGVLQSAPVLSLRSRMIYELNICWNNIIRRLFNYRKL